MAVDEFFYKGIPGYSTRGSYGKRGAEGNSVYFSTLIDSTIIANRIINKQNLSDNPNITNSSIDYKENDIIIARDSSVFIVKNNDIQHIGKLTNKKSKESQISPQHTEDSIVTNTVTIVDSSNMYNFESDCVSPFYHHRYNKKGDINFIKIEMPQNIKDLTLPIKIIATFDCGLTFEKIANTTEDCYILIDPMYFYMYGKSDSGIWDASIYSENREFDSSLGPTYCKNNFVNQNKLINIFVEYLDYNGNTMRTKLNFTTPS